MDLSDLQRTVNELPLSPRLPVLFVGHGNPMNAVWDNPFTRSLGVLGRSIEPIPSAILVVSAHWLSEGSFVNVSKVPSTIYDFYGFPRELYEVEYKVQGAPEYAAATAWLASATPTEEWGIDHGAWTVLKYLYPKADVPVFQLSISTRMSLEQHYELAKQLRPLRDRGVLIIGSGNIVHNLRMSIPRMASNDDRPYAWATEFDTWVGKRLDRRDFDELIDYRQAGEAGRLSVPTTDHYIPMLYTLGTVDRDEAITTTFEGSQLGGIGMRTFRVG